MSNYIAGQQQRHYVAHGDTSCRCPHCYGNNVQTIGTLTAQGTQYPTYQCNNCNVTYSGSDGGIASLLQEAKQNLGTQQVGFTATNASGVVAMGSSQNSILNGDMFQQMQNGYWQNGSASSISISNLPPDNSYKIDQTNSYLSGIQNEIRQLNNVIRDLIEQNHQLMNQLQHDPLIAIKKAVSEFNLK